MKRIRSINRFPLLAFASLALSLASSPSAFANDVDFYPNGFVSSAIREAQAARVAATAQSASEQSAAASASAQKSRAQVVAETREAARLGLLNTSEAGLAQPTPAQARQIELAGVRAVGNNASSQ